MIEIGKVQKLKVVKSVEFGIYLADPEDDSDSEERVLLPKKQIPEGTVLGDEIEVFIYRD